MLPILVSRNNVTQQAANCEGKRCMPSPCLERLHMRCHPKKHGTLKNFLSRDHVEAVALYADFNIDDHQGNEEEGYSVANGGCGK